MPRLSWLALALCLAAPGLALDVPAVPRTYVTDYAGILPEAARASLEARFAAIEQATGHQVLAVLFRSLDGESLEDFTVRCAEAWKVGRKGLNDGVIFFAFVTDRQMRIEVGYGLEGKIPDAVAHRILDTGVKPGFARGDYAAGISGLADNLQRVFRGEPLPERQSTRKSGSPPIGLIVVIVVLSVLSSLSRRSWRSGRGGGGMFWGGSTGGGSWGGGSFGGGGFSAGGGSFGGGGASGSW